MAEKNQFQIIFMPSGKRGHFDPGTTILQASRSLGVELDSVCGGRAICGRCQIQPTEGEFAKHGITYRKEDGERDFVRLLFGCIAAVYFFLVLFKDVLGLISF